MDIKQALYDAANNLMGGQVAFGITVNLAALIFYALIASIILPIICIMITASSHKKINQKTAELEVMISGIIKIFLDPKSTERHSCLMVYNLKQLELEVMTLNAKKLLDPREKEINALKIQIYKIIAHAKDDDSAWDKPCPKELL